MKPRNIYIGARLIFPFIHINIILVEIPGMYSLRQWTTTSNNNKQQEKKIEEKS